MSSIGQFDNTIDAVVSQTDGLSPSLARTQDPREGRRFIDDELLEWSEHESDVVSGEDSGLDDYASNTVDDEDWENAERDFTKQYNRLRQYVAVRAGTATGATSAVTNHSKVTASLPAINRPHIIDTASTPASRDKRTADQLAALSRYVSRITNISVPYTLGVGVNRKGPSERANAKDKSDRATSEQVLDPRTRIILFKMIGRGLIHEVNGCISTGKEANVYHALTPTSTHLALKVYKTSILIFKDRDRYVAGEYRFRRGYSRKNPRKMVKLWAEKEMRNLKRLAVVGIRCPEPVEVRENVLVMGFLGDKQGWASPRLKDADIPMEQYPGLYIELVLTIRKMFHDCKLVHADLSEYNIIYHDSHLYIIDVSQSVEHDHPAAFDFLKSDLKNVEEYFGRFGVDCLGVRRCFEFVTHEKVGGDSPDEESIHEWLNRARQPNDGEEAPEKTSETASQRDAVFLKSYLPRTLSEVYDPERDVEVILKGEGDGLIYKDVIGIDVGRKQEQEHEDKGDDKEGDDASEEDDDDDDSESKPFEDRQPRGHRHEDKDAKRERKKFAKEEARERRKHKMPKAEKKKRIKATKGV